jgi:hypothetical protein
VLRLGAYALAAVFGLLAALSFLLAASYRLQAPRAEAELARFRASHVEAPAIVDHVSRSGPAAPYIVVVKDPPGVPQLVEIDPYSYAEALRPGDSVTLRYWKSRVAEVLTASGTIHTPDDPAIIAEDSSPWSVLRSIAIGAGYSLLATAIVVAGRRWGAPLLGRR